MVRVVTPPRLSLLVIVDVPPLLQVAYATAAVQKANQALVVVCHNSPVENLRELRYRLDIIGVKALGYVYTNSPPRRSRSAVPPSSPAFDLLGHGNHAERHRTGLRKRR